MKTTNPILNKIMPYLVLAGMIILLILSFIVFWWIFLFALIVGLIAFAITYIRAKLFHHGKTSTIHEEFIIDIKRENNTTETHEKIGRIIEHDENEK